MSASTGDRVVMTSLHPWSTYSGVVVGPWPGGEKDWLVALDNGMNVGADDDEVRTADLEREAKEKEANR